LLLNKEYDFAITQFLRVFNEYPESNYAPRSLYSLGWLYETDLKNYDSSLYYYQLLMEKYPKSQYSKDVRLPVNYLLALQSGQPLPDSLKPVERKKEAVKGIGNKDSLAIESKKLEKEIIEPEREAGSMTIDPLQLIKDPTKLLKDAKEAITDPRLLEMNLPTDPFKDLRPVKKDSIQQEMKPIIKSDSTKVK